jgi:hypothetical protein
MKKSDKKVENAIRTALTNVCEQALETTEGFKWITHFVNYNNVPGSLSILCVFETDESLSAAKQSGASVCLKKHIQEELTSHGINIRNTNLSVKFDIEDNMH